MAKQNSNTRVRITRILIVVLAVATVPFGFITHPAHCNDPIAHWTSGDQAIQSIEANRITQALATTHATYGLGLTIDASSGQVISYYRSGPSERCADKWEPGSIMKPLTVATALDTDSITPTFTFYDSGSVTVDKQQIFNWTNYPHGTKNLETLLSDSLNVGAVAVQKQIKSKQIWYDYLANHFMLDSKHQSYIPPADVENAEYRYAESSFGVGVVATPLHMSLVYASLINGGIYHEACLSTACTSPGKQVVKKATSATMKQLLIGVYKDFSPNVPSGYIIGSKSGTAPLAQPTDEYDDNQDSGTYIGFIEHDGKTYIELVRLDQPQTPDNVASHAARAVWQTITNDIIAQHAL